MYNFCSNISLSLSDGQYKPKNRYPPNEEVTKGMQDWKIAAAFGFVVVLSVLVTGIAYSSYVNATRPASYNSYAQGTYGSYPYTSNPQYPTYPNTPTYPTQPNGPGYPQQPAYPPSYYPPRYSYPYGSYGEREGPWGMG